MRIRPPIAGALKARSNRGFPERGKPREYEQGAPEARSANTAADCGSAEGAEQSALSLEGKARNEEVNP